MQLLVHQRWLRTLAVVILLLLCSVPVKAQESGIRVVQDRADQRQGKKINFGLVATGPAKIDRVTLVYGVVGHGCTGDDQRERLDIEPNVPITANYELDLRYSFLPGIEIWWRWEIEDAAGNRLDTERKGLVLEDPDYRWQVLEQGLIRLQWAEGGPDFGGRMMEVAQRSMTRLAEEAGVESPDKIRLIIYPSVDDMTASLRGVADWAGGVAYPEYNLVVIGIGPQEGYSWAEKVIPHEITHLITEMGYANCEGIRLPIWLMEGLAQYAEGPALRSEEKLVVKALDEERLPELKTMRYSFPKDEEEAELAYAQSRLLVTFMIDQYGVEKMNRLLKRIHNGQTVDDSLRTIYGFNSSELDQAWRAGLGYGEAPEPNFATDVPDPTRTPYNPQAIKPSLWTPGPTSTATAATPSATPLPSASATPPAVAEVIPATKTPAPAAPVPAPGPLGLKNIWLAVLVCPAGLLGLAGLASAGGVIYYFGWVKKKIDRS
jgi:hypothetical protein